VGPRAIIPGLRSGSAAHSTAHSTCAHGTCANQAFNGTPTNTRHPMVRPTFPAHDPPSNDAASNTRHSMVRPTFPAHDPPSNDAASNTRHSMVRPTFPAHEPPSNGAAFNGTNASNGTPVVTCGPHHIPGLETEKTRNKVVLPGFRAQDAIVDEYQAPSEVAQGKLNARSLMQPQELARRILPGQDFETLQAFASGVPANCGPAWSAEVVQAARAAGPHVSALTDENVKLIWEDIEYQQQAGFVRVVPESILFGDDTPDELKISRVAVVPQTNRRGRIIVNLSAQVKLPTKRQTGHRRKRNCHHPSVNETTEPAQDQRAVAALGTALPAILQFMFDMDCSWEIAWQKIDLSDGFWRMIVEQGKEYNFVFQLPTRPGDTETFYVVPSSLQMGWQNSPAYFCTGTESARTLFKRLLALTFTTGISVVHRHESYCCQHPRSDESSDASPWSEPLGIAVLSKVFVDDFLNGIAGPVDRKRKRQEQEWVARGALHAIHAVFPPPDVLHHEGGRDSISEKKLKKGDARWKSAEVLLGSTMSGLPGAGRTVALPQAKVDKYSARIRAALARPRNFISFGEFQKIHGQMQHASDVMPCMKGFMSPLNRILATASNSSNTVGLGKDSELRETLSAFLPMLEAAHAHPSHISELVPPSLPHYYSYNDAAAVGAGGAWLPCTRWLSPFVWRVEWPPAIADEVRKKQGSVSNSDVEAAAAYLAECILDDELGGATAGVSSYVGTDNKPTESWFSRKASRASHRAPERLLRLQAVRQRQTRRGPQDVGYIEGVTNLLGDFPSRSYEQGFPRDSDAAFLAEFSHRHPLPVQLGSWRLVRPKSDLFSAVCSILLGVPNLSTQPATSTGESGAGSPTESTNTLSSLDCKEPTTMWNEATCSWPLLEPCGTVCMETDAKLRARKSRRRYAGVPCSWSPENLRTLGENLRDSTTSTDASPRT
jgi:hypothetical protein